MYPNWRLMGKMTRDTAIQITEREREGARKGGREVGRERETERGWSSIYVQGTTLGTKAYRLEQAKQDVCVYRPLMGLVEHDDSVLREVGVNETLSQHHSVRHVLNDRLLTRAVLEPNRVADLKRRIAINKIILFKSAVAVRKQKDAILARPPREISRTIRINCNSFLSRAGISVRPNKFV